MAKFLLIGALGGLINGFFGAGGGMVLVPLLLHVGTLAPKEAFASSLCIMLPICLLSAIFRAMDGSLDVSAALPYLLGGLGGGLLGGLLLPRLSTTLLNRVFALVILWGGVRLLWS